VRSLSVSMQVLSGVAENLLKHSPKAIFIIISNPMDTMAYLAFKKLGVPKHRVIGMGGALDSSRFTYFLSQAMHCSPNQIQATVIGGHGDTTMIPLTRLATYNGVPVSKFLSAEQLAKVAADTMVGGATLTGLLGTSAWYAPGIAGASMVESILRDEKRVFASSVYLEGEYGQSDICLGVPVVVGKNGWERIIDFDLTESEKTAFSKSADAVRSMNNVLTEMSVL